MRKVLQNLSNLGTGQKNRLKLFRSNLKLDYDRRNYDEKVSRMLRRYLNRQWSKEFRRTERYLRNLKSSKDGKMYSQGVKEYSKLLKSGLAFGEPNWTYFGWNTHYKKSKQMLIDEFSRLHLTPLSYQCDDDIVQALPKLGTHSGFTYILSGKKEKRENLENIYAVFTEEFKQATVNGSFGKPILPAVRTQGNGHAFKKDGSYTGDCDHKTRLVSMIDLIVIIAELVFAKPIQDYMATTKWYAGGKDLDHGVARVITGMRSRYRYWVSLDYSSFDQSVSAWLIHDAFEIIHSAFGPMTNEQEELFRLVEHDFVEKDFIFADEVIHSVRGVPSGSMFTQIIDSIVNVMVVRTYLLSKGLSGDMIVMGDDNLIYTMDEIDPEDLASYLGKNFGMKVNSQKTCKGRAFDHPTFLSREWWLEGQYREPHEVIAKMLYPERERTYSTGDCKPEEVIWGAYLCYPLGVRKFLNVEKFLADFPQLKRSSLRTMGSHALPGMIRYLRDYTGGFWSGGA